MPALEEPFGDERTADEGQRRSDELHDFDFVAAGVQPEADDGGHGDGGGQRHQQRQRQARAARRVRGRPPSRASHSRS